MKLKKEETMSTESNDKNIFEETQYSRTENSIKDCLKEIIEEDYKKGPINNGKDCPDKSLILKYIQGNVNKQEREYIIDHLADCNYCFVKTEQFRKSFIPVVMQLSFIKIYIILLLMIRNKYIQVLTFVCISIISADFFYNSFISIKPDIVQRINISCQSAINNKLVYNNSSLFLWEKEKDFIGFNFDIDPPLFKIAFAAGSWDSRSTINKSMKPIPDYLSIYKSMWEKTDNHIYYAIGKWHYMFTNACFSGESLPGSFLEEQIRIIENIQKTFKQDEIYDNITIIENLEKIHYFINNSFIEKKEDVLQALNNIRKYLEPESINCNL